MSDEAKNNVNFTSPIELGKLEYVSPKLWEPKLSNRFVVYIVDYKTKKLVIDKFLIRRITRPSFSLISDKKRHWHSLSIEVYDPIVPTNVLFKLLQVDRLNIQVNELGPVGDVVCTWTIPNCRFKHVEETSLDWKNSDISIIKADIDWTVIHVRDGADGCITLTNEQ